MHMQPLLKNWEGGGGGDSMNSFLSCYHLNLKLHVDLFLTGYANNHNLFTTDHAFASHHYCIQ